MNRNLVHFQMIVLLLISSASAFWLAVQRYRVEGRNEAIEVVLDYEDVAEMAAARGQTVQVFLKSLPFRCSVALIEGTLDTWGAARMTANGLEFLLPDELFQQAKSVLSLKTAVGSRQWAVERRDEARQKTANRKLHTANPKGLFVSVRSTAGGRFYVLGDPEVVREMGLGLNPLALQAVREAGCRPVARLENFAGANPDAIRGLLQQVYAQGIRLLIFSGDQVLGFRDGLDTTEDTIRNLSGLLYGSVEFGKQAGDSHLARALWERTVRVHSVNAAEATQSSPADLIKRYERAAQERNIRVFYVRFSGNATQQNLQERIQYLQDLQKALERDGFQITGNGAHPFDPVVMPGWLYPLVGAGVGALLGWMLACWWDTSRAQGLPLLGAILLALACLTLTGRKGTALLAALTFPTIGMITVVGKPGDAGTKGGGDTERPGDQETRRPEDEETTHHSPLTTRHFPLSHSPTPSYSQLWIGVISLLPPILTWSLLGALHIVGLLMEGFFLIQADLFMGVKLAHALPVLGVGLIYAVYVSDNRAPWRQWLTQPVFWWQAVLSLVVLVMLGIMLIRTGNEAPSAVPGWELRARAILEQVLSVRPRTKEFLIGYPALMLALGLLLTNRRSWLPLWMMVATIGQVSLVNTFCHLHSPLLVSLERTGWSILFGLVIGTVLLWMWWRYLFGRMRTEG